MATNEPPLDCRSETGITVGLVDSIMTLAHVLRGRLAQHEVGGELALPGPVADALRDLASDADLRVLLGMRARSLPAPSRVCPDTRRPCIMPYRCGEEGCCRQQARPPQHVWYRGRCVCGATQADAAAARQRCPGPAISARRP